MTYPRFLNVPCNAQLCKTAFLIQIHHLLNFEPKTCCAATLFQLKSLHRRYKLISLAPPQTAGLTHFVAPPLPIKSVRLYWVPLFLRCFWTRFAVCFFWASFRHRSEQYMVRPLAGNGFPQCLHRFAARFCSEALNSGSLGRTLSRKYRHMAFPQ